MNKTQRTILTILQEKGPVTPLELTLLSGYALSGIRRRMTDLRRMGYDIQIEKMEVNKYVLKKNGEEHQTADKIIEWIKEKNNFGKKINLDDISTDLNLPADKVTNAMGKVFKKYNVTQLSNKLIFVQDQT